MNVFTNQQLIQQDTEHLIHPLHHQGMHSNGLVWVRDKGAILEDADGNEYLDGLAGLWKNIAGHAQQTSGRRRIPTDGNPSLCFRIHG